MSCMQEKGAITHVQRHISLRFSLPMCDLNSFSSALGGLGMTQPLLVDTQTFVPSLKDIVLYI